jgi:hypothetical protein
MTQAIIDADFDVEELLGQLSTVSRYVTETGKSFNAR